MLGKYQVVRELGVGGMGAVYEAVHTGIGKAVALKIMNPALANDPRAEERFMREAAASSRLEHPNVTDVTDFGSDRGVVFIVMELLRGEDLAAVLSRAPAGLDPVFVADVMIAVCAGVFAAHQSNVVHRDLKPQNIFLSRSPLGEIVPKVLDFGISKLLDDSLAASSLTNSGSVMGTTHYLSPEQVTGDPIDGRSDEYALGVILYECLTGRRPHEGETIYAVMRSISEGRFNRPMALRPDLPPPFEAVVLRALATRAADRFPSVFALGRALLAFASPKTRVMWGEYYDRPLGPPDNARPNTHMVQPLTGAGRAGWGETRQGPGPMSMFGAPGPSMALPGAVRVIDDTRSGVAPVSVVATNELYRRQAAARRRRMGGAVLVLGMVAAAWTIFGPPQWFADKFAPQTTPVPAPAVAPRGAEPESAAVPATAEPSSQPGSLLGGADDIPLDQAIRAPAGLAPEPPAKANGRAAATEPRISPEPAPESGALSRQEQLAKEAEKDAEAARKAREKVMQERLRQQEAEEAAAFKRRAFRRNRAPGRRAPTTRPAVDDAPVIPATRPPQPTRELSPGGAPILD